MVRLYFDRPLIFYGSNRWGCSHNLDLNPRVKQKSCDFLYIRLIIIYKTVKIESEIQVNTEKESAYSEYEIYRREIALLAIQ